MFNHTQSALFTFGLVKTFLSSPSAEEFYCNISNCFIGYGFRIFSAREVACDMCSLVSNAVCSFKTNAFYTVSSVKMTNCIIADHFSFVMGI
jgi:hypothetical protein